MLSLPGALGQPVEQMLGKFEKSDQGRLTVKDDPVLKRRKSNLVHDLGDALREGVQAARGLVVVSLSQN